MQRRNVDLPEPERPMIATISPLSIDMLTSLRTSSAPKRLWMPLISTSDMNPPFEALAGSRQAEADGEIDGRHREVDLPGRKGGVVHDLPGPRQLDENEHRGERGDRKSDG